MGRTLFLIVSEDRAAIQEARIVGGKHGAVVRVFSPDEWRRQAQDPGFVLTLVNDSPSDEMVGAKVIQFPGGHGQPSYVGQPEKRIKSMDELESLAIRNAIEEFGGNLTEAARALRIGRATLYRKVKQFQIDVTTSRRKKAA